MTHKIALVLCLVAVALCIGCTNVYVKDPVDVQEAAAMADHLRYLEVRMQEFQEWYEANVPEEYRTGENAVPPPDYDLIKAIANQAEAHANSLDALPDTWQEYAKMQGWAPVERTTDDNDRNQD